MPDRTCLCGKKGNVMKIGSVILGFVMICVGVVDLAGQAPVLGIHPAVWFILGILLICSDSAWEKLAKKKKMSLKKMAAKVKLCLF